MMFCAQKAWVHLTRIYRLRRARSYSSSGGKNGDTSSTFITNSSNGENAESSIGAYKKAYRQLEKLDFMTAARILFTDPPKKKNFGIDFHLVQLFFACMPSLGITKSTNYRISDLQCCLLVWCSCLKADGLCDSCLLGGSICAI